MTQRKPAWDLLTDEERRRAIDAIVAHFLDERDETIGVIAAESFLDAVLEQVTAPAYNRGVADAKALLEQRWGDLNVDLDTLHRS
jgi:uncharacterized protein (DUF2164 family)